MCITLGLSGMGGPVGWETWRTTCPSSGPWSNLDAWIDSVVGARMGVWRAPTKQRVMAGSRQLWTDAKYSLVCVVDVPWPATGSDSGRPNARLLRVQPLPRSAMVVGVRTGGVEAVRAKHAIAAASSTDTHSKQVGNWPTRPWLEACHTLKHGFHRCFAALCTRRLQTEAQHCIVHRRMHCLHLGPRPDFFPSLSLSLLLQRNNSGPSPAPRASSLPASDLLPPTHDTCLHQSSPTRSRLNTPRRATPHFTNIFFGESACWSGRVCVTRWMKRTASSNRLGASGGEAIRRR